MKQTGILPNNISSSGNPFLLVFKNTQFFVKFAVCFLVLGLLAHRLYFSSSFTQFSSVAVAENEFLDNAWPPIAPPREPPSYVDILLNDTNTSQTARCDIFLGEWVPDPTGPFYTNTTCYAIEEHQNCMKNGRPDSGYIFWRWNPRDCELPRFNPQRFLHFMTDKSMAFIGDSISRNHLQSLLCILSQAEEAVEVYHDEEYKSKRWVFPSHNFTISVIWTPFLVKGKTFEDNNGVSSGIIQLYLDKLDTVWTDQYNNFDYVVIAGGKWFLKAAIYYENSTTVGCHNCAGKNLTELGFEYAYRKTVQLVLKFITSAEHKVDVLLRTTTPDHFENGEWHNGGYCNRTGPFKEDEIIINDVDTIMRDIELEEFKKAMVDIGSKTGSNLRVLDTTYLSLLRPDGHPGVYRKFHPYAKKDRNIKLQNDCLHWCLPGPIDSWNDLVMEMLLNGGR